MSKKQGFLKRNPIVPSIFFILFAWSLLYLITGVKGASKNQNTEITSPNFNFQNTSQNWKINFSEDKIQFQTGSNKKTQKYTDPKVKFIETHDNHTIQVFSAQNEQGKILVHLTRFKPSVYQVLVQQGDEYYYYYGK
jgi:hypothetical protein